MEKRASFFADIFKNVDRKPLYLILPLFVYMFVFYIYPLLRMFIMSLFSPGFTFKHYQSFFQTTTTLYSLRVTFEISLLVTILCLLVGYPLAYYLSTRPAKKANLLLIPVLIPLWTSVLVRTYAWIAILGRNGVINQMFQKSGLIEQPLKLLYNQLGLTIGMVHVMMPFMVLSLYSVMVGIDRNLLKAAQNLGASPFKAFRKVFLPLSMPGILAGCILVFIISVGFFVTPALLGGPRDLMISMVIDQAVEVMLNWGFASAASFILLFLILGIFLISGKMVGFDKLWGKKI
jgi:ABC-type spermidine/putrescine transport system permease subunit I